MRSLARFPTDGCLYKLWGSQSWLHAAFPGGWTRWKAGPRAGLPAPRSGREKLALSMALVVFSLPASADLVDRIAVAVGNRAIKESQIIGEIRVAAFLNGGPLDLSGPAKRKAAEQLVDQALIRTEMARGSYPAPSDGDVNDLLKRIKDTEFHGDSAAYRTALAKYGLTEADLKAHLAWQLQVLRFIQLRFEPAVRMRAAKNTSAAVIGERVNVEFFAWLDQARARARIQFHDEVFQ